MDREFELAVTIREGFLISTLLTLPAITVSYSSSVIRGCGAVPALRNLVSYSSQPIVTRKKDML